MTALIVGCTTASLGLVGQAHAAGSVGVSVDPDVPLGLIVDGSATATQITVFFNNGTGDVEFSSPQGFAYWPEGCILNGTGVACPGAAVDHLTFQMSSGDDEITLPTVCVPVVVVEFGAGDDYFRNTACPASVRSVVDAGSGDDKVYLSPGDNRADGGPGDDEIIGGIGADRMSGGDGKDLIFGDAGKDVIDGGGGNDHLVGGPGDDTTSGGAGNDRIGFHVVLGGDGGANKVSGGKGTDTLDLRYEPAGLRISLDGKANDGRPGAKGNVRPDVENILGTQHNDVIVGSKANNMIDGYSGNDTISSGAGNDRVFGFSGNDRINSGPGKDEVHGGSHNDKINPGPGADVVYGDSNVCNRYDCDLGADRIQARDGARDYIHCGPGADTAKLDRRDVVDRGRDAKCESVRR